MNTHLITQSIIKSFAVAKLMGTNDTGIDKDEVHVMFTMQILNYTLVNWLPLFYIMQ